MKFAHWISFSCIFLLGCHTGSEDKTNPLIGEWQATWELKDPGLTALYSKEQLSMPGNIVFGQDNKVSIIAYGFEGCVFSADTAENQLIYQLEDSLVRILNNEQEIIFSYLIEDIDNEKASMSLLNDIKLLLVKK